ncbi:unnamed protein product, partial [Mesorhabditis spiculigera]
MARKKKRCMCASIASGWRGICQEHREVAHPCVRPKPEKKESGPCKTRFGCSVCKQPFRISADCQRHITTTHPTESKARVVDNLTARMMLQFRKTALHCFPEFRADIDVWWSRSQRRFMQLCEKEHTKRMAEQMMLKMIRDDLKAKEKEMHERDEIERDDLIGDEPDEVEEETEWDDPFDLIDAPDTDGYFHENTNCWSAEAAEIRYQARLKASGLASTSVKCVPVCIPPPKIAMEIRPVIGKVSNHPSSSASVIQKQPIKRRFLNPMKSAIPQISHPEPPAKVPKMEPEIERGIEPEFVMEADPEADPIPAPVDDYLPPESSGSTLPSEWNDAVGDAKVARLGETERSFFQAEILRLERELETKSELLRKSEEILTRQSKLIEQLYATLEAKNQEEAMYEKEYLP